jgi:hypothetical protein
MVTNLVNLPVPEMDALCRAVEERWPGALAAYRDFAVPRMQPEDSDCLIEVFFVDQAIEFDVIRATFTERRRLRRQLDCHVSIVCHDVAVSTARYARDIASIRANRRQDVPVGCVAPVYAEPIGLLRVASSGGVTSLTAVARGHRPFQPYEIGAELWQLTPAA